MRTAARFGVQLVHVNIQGGRTGYDAPRGSVPLPSRFSGTGELAGKLYGLAISSRE
jgi:hypothetical protein